MAARSPRQDPSLGQVALEPTGRSSINHSRQPRPGPRLFVLLYDCSGQQPVYNRHDNNNNNNSNENNDEDNKHKNNTEHIGSVECVCGRGGG